MSLPIAEPICRCALNGNNSMVRNTLKPTQVAQYLGNMSSNRIGNARSRRGPPARIAFGECIHFFSA